MVAAREVLSAESLPPMESFSGPPQIPLLSFFCGAGGLDQGFVEAGFRPVLAFDSNPAAVATYNANIQPVAICKDIAALSAAEVLDTLRGRGTSNLPRGVIGGPPCQGFSLGNPRHSANDPRNELPFLFAKLLAKLTKHLPIDFFVFENVTGLTSPVHSDRFKRIICAFESAGFEVTTYRLNAVDFGVPQTRRRILLVGLRKEVSRRCELHIAANPTHVRSTVADALGALPLPSVIERRGTLPENKHHPNHCVMKTKSRRFETANWGTGKTRSFRILDWHRPSPTVAYGNREMHVHPTGLRRVSVYEAMLLQGFPRKFQMHGNFSEQVTQVSNAVPPPLARAIAQSIRAALYHPFSRQTSPLLDWYSLHGRRFPWRNTRNPYEVIVAEKLLQQTAASPAVVRAFRSVVREFPTIDELGSASLRELTSIIAPLGLPRRASELRAMAQTISREHNGKVPDTLPALLRLPGIGDYAARAVLTFCYNQHEPPVDCNVARVLSRVLFGKNYSRPNPARDVKLIDLAKQFVPPGQARDVTLALLDLSSSFCTSQRPACDRCPLRDECKFRRAHASSIP